MSFPLYINTAAKRAVAHPMTCPEVPQRGDRVQHETSYWMEFDAEEAIKSALAKFRSKGFDARWCKCRDCQDRSRPYGPTQWR